MTPGPGGPVIGVVADGRVLVRERYGLEVVALSGGVFQNVLLLERAVSALEARGFCVLVHSRVPCNDGGISLGQAVVATVAPPRWRGRSWCGRCHE